MKSYIVLLIPSLTGTLNFLGSGLTLVGVQHKAYHYTNREEAENRGYYFCQENRAVYFDYGVEKECDFIPHVIEV